MCLPHRLGLQYATVLGMFPLYDVPLLHLDLEGLYIRVCHGEFHLHLHHDANECSSVASRSWSSGSYGAPFHL